MKKYIFTVSITISILTALLCLPQPRFCWGVADLYLWLWTSFSWIFPIYPNVNPLALNLFLYLSWVNDSIKYLDCSSLKTMTQLCSLPHSYIQSPNISQVSTPHFMHMVVISALDQISFIFHLDFFNHQSVIALTHLQSVLGIAARVFFLDYQWESVISWTKMLQWAPSALRMKSKLLTIRLNPP